METAGCNTKRTPIGGMGCFTVTAVEQHAPFAMCKMHLTRSFMPIIVYVLLSRSWMFEMGRKMETAGCNTKRTPILTFVSDHGRMVL
jgi:hypothetical protein